ncbi:hypothetical protein J6590_008033 [Homalodisca vitripennis]|nr:hypothetical protein J6590_008033 [Homalodisca vitripennis]
MRLPCSPESKTAIRGPRSRQTRSRTALARYYRTYDETDATLHSPGGMRWNIHSCCCNFCRSASNCGSSYHTQRGRCRHFSPRNSSSILTLTTLPISPSN